MGRFNYPLDDLRRIDTLRNALFPDMPNNTCGLYARDGEASFFDLDSDTFWLGLVLNTDTIRLVAYADLETDAARYPGYLTRGEAAAAAKQALADAYGLTVEQTESLALIQGGFTLQKEQWTDADVPAPYWYLVFSDEADGQKTRYEALIDAETGDTLGASQSGLCRKRMTPARYIQKRGMEMKKGTALLLALGLLLAATCAAADAGQFCDEIPQALRPLVRQENPGGEFTDCILLSGTPQGDYFLLLTPWDMNGYLYKNGAWTLVVQAGPHGADRGFPSGIPPPCGGRRAGYPG